MSSRPSVLYSMTGSVMTTVINTTPIPDDIKTNATGTVITTYPNMSAIINSGTEIINHNMYYSGTENIETFSSGAKRHVYLSKQNTLQYLAVKHPAQLNDLINNIPDTSPSASYVVGVANGFTGYMDRIGTLSSTIYAGNGLIGSILIGPTSPSTVPLLLSALSGNLIGVGSSPSNCVYFAVDTPLSTSAGPITVECPVGCSNRLTDMTASSAFGIYLMSMIPLSSSLSGVYLNKNYYTPSMIKLPVTNEGKIRDIRAWVEFIHDNRLQTVSNGTGLSNIQIALQSPNTNFNAAHPTWNSSAAVNLPLRDPSVSSSWQGNPGLLQNSYLLWAGHRVEDGILDEMPFRAINYYHEFDNDIDMRTVFWDGAKQKNPRDLSVLFPSASLTSPGSGSLYLTILNDSASYASPQLGADLLGVSLPAGVLSLTGAGIPWMFDNRIVTGSGLNSTLALPSGSPPPGWVTDGVDEFATTGSNFGPLTITPVYPLLDDVYAFKATVDPRATTDLVQPGSGLISGFRPGLRNTEMQGNWNFLFGGTSTNSSIPFVAAGADIGSGIWMRQVRLEFISDSGVAPFDFTPSRSKLWSRKALVRSDGPQNISIMSGAAAWDFGVNMVQRVQQQQYGRTVGCTDDTTVTSYAVLSYLSGDLENSLNAQGIFGDPTWFLSGNGYGTPYIPNSSMTLGVGITDANQIDAAASAAALAAIIGQTTLIPNANTITDYLNREGYAMTAEQRWLASISASSGS